MTTVRNKKEGREYRDGRFCLKCEKEVTFGSKSGFCKSCSAKKPKKIHIKFECKQCRTIFYSYPCRKSIFCSKSCQAKSQIGIKLPKERVLKSIFGHQGEKSHFWKGGVTPINKAIRGSYQYEWWRKSVFKRDNYTCKKCGARSCVGKRVYLQADHIKPFSLFPDLRFELSNGRTLCVDCHKTTETYMWKIRNYVVA